MNRSITRRRVSVFAMLLLIALTTFCWESATVSAGLFGSNQVDGSQAALTQFTANITGVARLTNALVYHPQTGKVYASIPSAADAGGNSIARIDPSTGTIEQSTWVGSEPNRLVLANDGNTLYVGLDGARAVRRFDIATSTAGLQFAAGLGTSSGPLKPVDIAVSPTDPNVVAVSRIDGVSSSSRGVAVFDNGIPRTKVAGSGAAITFGATDAVIYGHTFYTDGLQRMSVDASGVTLTSSAPSSAGKRLSLIGGRLYNSYGKVMDPATGNPYGTFPAADSYGSERPFAVDLQLHRAFFAIRGDTGLEVSAYDIDTFVLLGTIVLPVSGDPIDLVRWGTNGVAISVKDNFTYFVQSDLVAPGAIAAAVPTPTPTPTPAVMAFTRRVDVRTNDVLYNPADQSVYASVPGVAGAGLGNTITKIDPKTGNLLSSTFVGSEPMKLGISDDGGTIYTHLNGANAIRRFATATQTAGAQFSLPYSSLYVIDLLVLPGMPDSVVVARGSDGLKIYDNGVARPAAQNVFGGYVEHNGTADTIYDLNDASPSSISKVAVGPNGLSLVNSFQNIIEIANQNILFDSGRIYTPQGRVLDPETGALLGQFFYPGTYFGGSAIAVDSVQRRAFLLMSNCIAVYDIDTFNRVGLIPYTPIADQVTGKTVIQRWGPNGLVFRVQTNTGNSSIFFVQSPLISPVGTLPIGYALGNAAQTLYEGAGSVTVNVYRTGDTTVASSVDYSTVNGTATAGTDFPALNGTLNFAPGETVKPLTLTANNDNVYEGPESFQLVLSTPTGANAEIISPSTCALSIVDAQYRPYISTPFTLNTNEPPAGGSGAVNISVSLTNRSTEAVTVDFKTVNGTAIAGSDYIATAGKITFAPLQTSTTVPVQILGDTTNEGNEDFYLVLSNPTNASGLNYGQTDVTIINNPYKPRSNDFDGDGKADESVFRPSNGTWYLNRSQAGFTGYQFGATDDLITPGDFTGDGKTDVAVFRPSTGTWFVLRSEDNTFYGAQFGASGDIPAPGDYDGDGKADTAVFRPSSGTWFIQESTVGFVATAFGTNGDVPTVGDFDGDGKADVAVFRPSNGTWYRLNSSNGSFVGAQFGQTGDQVVAADYTGDGKTDLAVWRPSEGTWYIQKSEDSSFYGIQFGVTGDLPAPGDYDGDGKADTAVFRPSTGTWFEQRSTTGFAAVAFGANGDKPGPNAFVY